jgi:hypothetical protein
VLFKKLFQMLVLGGAVIGTSSGCTPSAEAQTAPKKDAARDAGPTAAPDAGLRRGSSGGGAKTW